MWKVLQRLFRSISPKGIAKEPALDTLPVKQRVRFTKQEHDALVRKFPALVCTGNTTAQQLGYIAGVHAVLAAVQEGWVVE